MFIFSWSILWVAVWLGAFIGRKFIATPVVTGRWVMY